VAKEQHQQIDRYLIRRVLGTGAMGSVYAAWDPKLHREVALKVVPSRLSVEGKGRERFHREARAIAAVRHPNIVEIYDYSGTDSEYLYLVIEKLDGEDLYATLHRRGVMPEAVAAAVGHELGLALQVAHEAGIIHRDLKPENVFLNASGRVVLTDFGIVKAVREDSAVDGYRENTDVIGTPGFMAPELMTGKGLGPPIDIFALGALLYNITTKRLPFEGASPLAIFHAAAAGRYDDPRKHNPQLSEEFCSIIAQCLNPNPRKRPRSAEMVRLALKTALEDAGVSDVRDDLRDYMHNAEAYRAKAHSRAVRHIVQQVKVASKDHDTQHMRRLRQRLMVLDPYNEDLNDVSGVVQGVGEVERGGTQNRWHNLVEGVQTLMQSGVHSVQDTVQRVHETVPRWLAVVIALLVLGCGGLAALTAMQPDPPVPASVSMGPSPSLAKRIADITHSRDLTRPFGGGEPVGTPLSPPEPAKPAPPSGEGAAAAKPAPPPTKTRAWLELQVVGGSNATLVLDGQPLGRLTRKSVQVMPGRHVVEIMVRHGRRLRRVITLTAGDKLALRADFRRGQLNVQ
jgi:serine/threonine protein kinase